MDIIEFQTLFLVFLTCLCVRPTGAQDNEENIDLQREQGERVLQSYHLLVYQLQLAAVNISCTYIV